MSSQRRAEICGYAALFKWVLDGESSEEKLLKTQDLGKLWHVHSPHFRRNRDHPTVLRLCLSSSQSHRHSMTAQAELEDQMKQGMGLRLPP